MKAAWSGVKLHLVALAVLAGLAVSASAAPVKGLLLSDDQLATEALAAQLMKSPALKAQRQVLVSRMRADPAARTPSGKRTLENDATEMAYNAALSAANSDPARPKLVWGTPGPFAWKGYKKPGGRWAVDNPDNVYRFFPIDGNGRYEVTVHPRLPGPVQFSFLVWDSFMGEDTKTLPNSDHKYLDKPIAGLLDRDIKAEADGSFRITIDSDPANGRANHIQTNADARMVYIRETTNDWGKQNPLDITIARVADGNPIGDPPTFDEMAQRAAHILAGGSDLVFWYKNKGLVAARPNTLTPPWLRGGGWGFNVNGQFTLAKDEALLVHVDPLGAKYLGFIVTDPWLVSSDHFHATATLNNTQAEANKDGSYTYVVSAADPGIRNWINTGGLEEGFILLRFQALPEGFTSADGAVRSVEVVKLTDLPQHLPAEATRFTPQMRKAQHAERAKALAHHYGFSGD